LLQFLALFFFSHVVLVVTIFPGYARSVGDKNNLQQMFDAALSYSLKTT